MELVEDNNKGIVHLGLLIVVIVAIGVVGYLMFQGGQLLQQQTPQNPGEQETDSTNQTKNSFRLNGIDYILEEALRVELESEEEDLLVLTLRMESNTKCPLTGGAVCGYDARRFKLTDKDGFLLDSTGLIPPIELETDPLSQRILKEGEKDEGTIEFLIPKDKNSFILTYSSSDGSEEKSIEIIPKTYDPLASWGTYVNEEYGFSLRHPLASNISNCDINDDEYPAIDTREENLVVHLIPSHICSGHDFVINYYPNDNHLTAFEYFVNDRNIIDCSYSNQTFNCILEEDNSFSDDQLSSEHEVTPTIIGGKDALTVKTIKTPGYTIGHSAYVPVDNIMINIQHSGSELTNQILSTFEFTE